MSIIEVHDTDVWFSGGWCGNEDCSCYEPGMPCDEYMGPVPCDDESGRVDLRCPRCGWSEGAHNWAAKHRTEPAPEKP